MNEGSWSVKLSKDYSAITIYREGKRIGEYSTIKEPYCEICAFPKQTNECRWHWNDKVEGTYAVGIYYPTRRREHSSSLLSQHIIKLKSELEYATPLGLSMVMLLNTRYKDLLGEINIITPIPKHSTEYKVDKLTNKRYNQAEELAKIISAKLTDSSISFHPNILIKQKEYSQKKSEVGSESKYTRLYISCEQAPSWNQR